jgi:hypothetical protein
MIWKAGTCARINFIDAGKKAEKSLYLGLFLAGEIELYLPATGPVVVKVDDTRKSIGSWTCR